MLQNFLILRLVCCYWYPIIPRKIIYYTLSLIKFVIKISFLLTLNIFWKVYRRYLISSTFIFYYFFQNFLILKLVSPGSVGRVFDFRHQFHPMVLLVMDLFLSVLFGLIVTLFLQRFKNSNLKKKYPFERIYKFSSILDFI